MKRIFILLVAAAWGLSVSGRFQPADPLYKQPCGSCHMADVAAGDTRTDLLFAAEEKLCVDCHPNALVASHPSGQAPSMPLPPPFQTDWKGDLTCSTCHHVHEERHGQMRTDTTGKSFCLSCHTQRFFQAMPDQGLSLLASGHLEPEGSISDPFSLQCLSCHDDKGESPELRTELTSQGLVRHRSGTNHPIGTSYSTATRFGGYHPLESLPAAIQLPGGKLSCISCHLAYTERHGELITATTGTPLCFLCHDL